MKTYESFIRAYSESRKRNPRVKRSERDTQEALPHCRSHVQGLFVWIPVEEDDPMSRLLLIEEVAHLFNEDQDAYELQGNFGIPSLDLNVPE